MIKTRTRKILSDIISRKGRSALVIISIMIGVFGVTTLVGMNDLVVSQLSDDLQPDHIAMSHIYLTTTSQTPLSAEDNAALIEDLYSLEGVTDIEGQAIYRVNFQNESDAASEDFTSAFLFSYTEDYENIDLEPISRIVEGRYPVSGQNEIAIEQRFADEHGVSLGDQITFRQLDPNAEPETWEVVGVVFHSYFTISVAEQNNVEPQNNIYATYEDAQHIAGFTGLNSIYLRYETMDIARDGLETAKTYIAQNSPYIPVFTFMDDPDDSYLIGQVTSVTDVLNMLAAVSMIVSGFLVTNVINTIVLEQKQQIGVMKSIGASRFDNFFIYTGMALVYGFIGSVLGVLLAIPIASMLAQELAPLAFTLIEDFRISTTAVILGFGLGLLVPVIAALIPVYNGTRVSILDAMTDLGISSNWGSSRLARWIGNSPLPVNIRQALSNLAQKSGRLALTGLTLTLAVGAFMGVTAVFTALGDTIEDLYATFDYEMVIVPQEPQDYDTINTLLTDNFEEINFVYPGYSVSVNVTGYESTEPLSAGSSQLQASGIDPASPVIQFDLEEGDGWTTDPTREGVIITRSLADNINKSLGDTVELTISGQPYSYEIIGIDGFAFDVLFMDWQELATAAGYVDANGTPLSGTFYVSLHGEPAVENVDTLINDMTDLLVTNNIQATYINQVEVEELQVESMSLFSMIFNMTSGVMAAVGAVGLLATLFMSVYERQKEIGVMRSIGARSRTIVSQFLVEGLLVGIIAWLVAIPLSALLGLGLAEAMSFGNAFTFTYPPQVLVLGLVGVIIIATIASIWPSLSAARRTVSDILRYQ